jgi:hypothetical protein
VKGYGFTSGNIVATVDGVACSVTRFQDSSFSCELQAASAVSTSATPQAGAHGLRRRFYNHTGSLSLSTYETLTYTEMLNLNAEVPYTEDNYIANKLQGWFIPPATTRYRFYQACDAACRLKVGTTANDATNPTTAITAGWSSSRDFFKVTDGGRSSDWITMTAGEPYYFEAEHVENTGTDHMTVAVEIE